MIGVVRVIGLWLAVLAAGWLLMACGGGGGEEFDPSTSPSDPVPTEKLGKVNAIIAGSDWFVGANNFVVGVTDGRDQPQGKAEVRIAFYDNVGTAQQKLRFTIDAEESAPGVGQTVEHIHAGGQKHSHGGQDEDRVGYFARVTFDHAGDWGASVEATLKDGTKGTSNVGFRVAEKSSIVAPGLPAPRSHNLVKSDVKNVSEIDSGVPPNDMHDVRIKDAIAAGRPVVVVFSTPAFCASRFCGPVNEEVEALREVHRQRVDFVHIEIWKNFDKGELNPTVGEWLVRPDGSLSEPFVFVVDSKGIVYDRFEGPVARNIMAASVRAVAEGQVFAAAR